MHSREGGRSIDACNRAGFVGALKPQRWLCRICGPHRFVSGQQARLKSRSESCVEERLWGTPSVIGQSPNSLLFLRILGLFVQPFPRRLQPGRLEESASPLEDRCLGSAFGSSTSAEEMRPPSSSQMLRRLVESDISETLSA